MAWYVALGVLGGLAAFFPWNLGVKADPFALGPGGNPARMVFPLHVPVAENDPGKSLVRRRRSFGGAWLAAWPACCGYLLPFFDSEPPSRTKRWITGLAIFALVYMAGMSIYGYLEISSGCSAQPGPSGWPAKRRAGSVPGLWAKQELLPGLSLRFAGSARSYPGEVQPGHPRTKGLDLHQLPRGRPNQRRSRQSHEPYWDLLFVHGREQPRLLALELVDLLAGRSRMALSLASCVLSAAFSASSLRDLVAQPAVLAHELVGQLGAALEERLQEGVALLLELCGDDLRRAVAPARAAPLLLASSPPEYQPSPRIRELGDPGRERSHEHARGAAERGESRLPVRSIAARSSVSTASSCDIGLRRARPPT